MDIRISGLPKIRVLPKRDSVSPQIADSAFRAEAMAERAIGKIRPGLIWIFGLRRRLATISVLVLTVWLFAHVMFGANGMMIYRAKRAEVLSLQGEIDSLQKENDRYSNQINDLKTDPKTIEKEAREQLHYARPGEVVYVSPILVNAEPAPTNAAEK
jgi:cell division protein FtsB